MLTLIWGGYCVLHSFLISISFTNVMTRLLKRYYAFYRLFYVIISTVLLVLIINYPTQLDDKIIITYEPPWSIIRIILVIGSLLMFFRAFFFDYDALSFFGFRQIQNFIKGDRNSFPVEIKKGGLLGITRHPMYLALIIFLWSQIFTMADLVVNFLLTVYVIIGTKLEEKKLVIEFGDAYVKYQQEVPMLIPYRKRKQVILKNT